MKKIIILLASLFIFVSHAVFAVGVPIEIINKNDIFLTLKISPRDSAPGDYGRFIDETNGAVARADLRPERSAFASPNISLTFEVNPNGGKVNIQNFDPSIENLTYMSAKKWGVDPLTGEANFGQLPNSIMRKIIQVQEESEQYAEKKEARRYVEIIVSSGIFNFLTGGGFSFSAKIKELVKGKEISSPTDVRFSSSKSEENIKKDFIKLYAHVSDAQLEKRFNELRNKKSESMTDLVEAKAIAEVLKLKKEYRKQVSNWSYEQSYKELLSIYKKKELTGIGLDANDLILESVLINLLEAYQQAFKVLENVSTDNLSKLEILMASRALNGSYEDAITYRAIQDVLAKRSSKELAGRKEEIQDIEHELVSTSGIRELE